MVTFRLVDDSGALAGAATEINLINLGIFSLSAVKAGDGELLLIGWRTDGDIVERRATSADDAAGEVNEISVTRNLNRTVTAVQAGDGNLKLISWNDNAGAGPITRLSGRENGEGPATGATSIAIANVGSPSNADLVTAYRTGGVRGRLRLISWDLRSGDGFFTMLGDSGDQEEVSLVAAVELGVNTNIVVTPVASPSGDLRLISWRIAPDGTAITRLAESVQVGTAGEISMAGSVTAVRDATGNLKLISWRIAPDGTAITRLDETEQVGQATNITISQQSPSRYITASRTAGGTLRLTAFDVDSSGVVTQVGDSGDIGGVVSENKIALISGEALGPRRLVTAHNDGDRLKVSSWDIEN